MNTKTLVHEIHQTDERLGRLKARHEGCKSFLGRFWFHQRILWTRTKMRGLILELQRANES